MRQKRKLRVVGAGALVFVGSCALVNLLLVDRGSIREALASSPELGTAYTVDIVVPEVRTNKLKKPDAKGCHGCSLAKHTLPDYDREIFEAALEGYAKTMPWQESESLEVLLFHSKATLELLEKHGSGPLPPEHVAFLRGELTREAVVEIRMVDEHGVVRITYGPERVPFGVKEHLAPKETGNLFAMEFNGTVMRTGLYHLWSRY